MSSILTLGGFTANWTLNVTAYPSFQAAIDAMPSHGGTIYVPAGLYTRETVPVVTPMTVTNKSIRFKGDVAGRVGQTDGSRISYTADDLARDLTSDLITVSGSNSRVIFEDISFNGAATGTDGNAGAGAGRGLVLENMHAFSCHRCTFEQFPSWAVDQGASDLVNAVFDHCDFWYSRSNGLVRLGDSTGVAFYNKFYHCNFIPTTDLVTPTTSRGLYLGKNEYTIIRDTIFQTSMPDAANQELLYANYPTTGSRKLIVEGCWFENIYAQAVPTSHMIGLVGPAMSVTVNDCFFTRSNTATSLRALKITNDGSAKSVYRLMFSNNMGHKDQAPDWTGTDDIELASGSQVTMMNNLRTMTGAGGYFDGYWRIAGENAGLCRINDGRVTKLREIAEADIAGLTDLRGAEFAYSLDAAGGDEIIVSVGGVIKRVTWH